jgi:hypothetical protein
MEDRHRQNPPVLDAEQARQGRIRKRPMTRVLGASLVLAVLALLLAYLFVF